MPITLIIVASIAMAVYLYMCHPKFGRQPNGKRMERILSSPNYRDGAFRNQYPTPQITSDQGRMRLMLDFLFEKREHSRPDYDIPVVKTDLLTLKHDENLFLWFGHSSYFMQVDGKRILIDPVFEEASPVSFFNKPFMGTNIYKAGDMPDIDYLIITHDHWDHLDYTTVTKLKGRIGKVICPLGVGEYFEQWGFKPHSIIELDWHERVALTEGYTVHCLPSRHFSGRTFKSNQTLWASFMLQTPSQTIFIGGDGGYDVHFAEIAKQFPRIDLAIMENGQYNKEWRYIHLMPEDLVKAINDLSALKVFTGHNSKYALAKHPWNEPLNHIASVAEKDSINLIISLIGEVVLMNDTARQVKKWWLK